MIEETSPRRREFIGIVTETVEWVLGEEVGVTQKGEQETSETR